MQTHRASVGTAADFVRAGRSKLSNHPIDAVPGPGFSYGLKKDFNAVIAAVETSWSNGQTEGQINRLKAIKRQMYGRAGFHLLRARVLPYQAMAP